MKKLVILLAAVSFSFNAFSQGRNVKPVETQTREKKENKSTAEGQAAGRVERLNSEQVAELNKQLGKTKLRTEALDLITNKDIKAELLQKLSEKVAGSSKEKYTVDMIVALLNRAEKETESNKVALKTFIENSVELMKLDGASKEKAEIAIQHLAYEIVVNKLAITEAAKIAISKAFPELKGDALAKKIEEFINLCIGKV